MGDSRRRDWAIKDACSSVVSDTRISCFEHHPMTVVWKKIKSVPQKIQIPEKCFPEGKAFLTDSCGDAVFFRNIVTLYPQFLNIAKVVSSFDMSSI